MFPEAWLYSADCVGTQSLPSEAGVPPLTISCGVTVELGGLSKGAGHGFQCQLGEDTCSMGWQPRGWFWAWQMSSPLVSRLAAPFPMEIHILHCLGVCQGASQHPFFESLLSAPYMGGQQARTWAPSPHRL